MSKNWDKDYKGMWVPNGHGSLFRAMDEDARIIAQCEANKLLWIAEANKQKPQPLSELEKALVEIKALKEASAAKDLKIANMFSEE